MYKPWYAFFTSSSTPKSPTITSTPASFNFSSSAALVFTVFREVRIAMRPKLDFAETICCVMYVPIAPVAPIIRIFGDISVVEVR